MREDNIGRVKDIINQSNKKLSIKEISELTGISRSSVARYCEEIGYEPVRHNVWNKGLTKETNSSIQKSSVKLKGKARGTRSKEIRRKISQGMKLNLSAGGHREVSGRGEKHIYNSLTNGEVILNSDSLFGIAKIMDIEKIDWEKSNTLFDYSDASGSMRKGTVDFYLPDYDLYIAVKINVTNVVRHKFLDIKKRHNIDLLIVDEMVYRRIMYSGMKDAIKNFVK